MHENESEPQAKRAAEELIQHIEAAKAQFDEVNDRIEKRAGRNLFLAIGTGLLIGAVLLVSLIFFKWAFLALCVVAGGAAAIELATALRTAQVFVPRFGAAAASVLAMAGATFFGLQGLLLGWLAGIVLLLAWWGIERARRGRGGSALFREAISAVGVVTYTGLLVGFAVLLLLQPRGEWWVLGFIVVVVANDTGAYATGVALGRHPMAPAISPKKSWEGFAGGALIALVAGVLVSWLMLPSTPVFGVLFGACLVASGTLGDLLESVIKRRIGVKDMSSWLPGHGGVLDRLDSIILSAPVAYFLFCLTAL